MNRVVNVIRVWLPIAVAVTGVCALAYVAVQQALRMSANDPQIQMGEDASAALENGTAMGAVVPKQQVEFSASLGPFLDLYDPNGKPVAGNGLLEGKLPEFPLGALRAAETSGENLVTWQPRTGVRIASVVVRYEDGYLVAGRNMREVEKREAQAETLAVAGWLLTLVAVLAAVAFGEYVLEAR